MPFIGGTNDLSASPEQYLIPTGPRNIIVIHRNEVVLTAGSDLNTTAVSSGSLGNPWPRIVGTFMRRLFKGSWKPNNLREVAHHNVNGNYGSKGGVVGYGFRGREFGGVGNMPSGVGALSGSHSSARRPEYNNLLPIVYGLRDIDPRALAQLSELSQITTVPLGPMEYQPGGSASLQETLL